MRKTSFVLTTALLISLGFSYLWSASEAEEVAVSSARFWLSLIDYGRYSSSWQKASAYFRGAVTEKSWTASMEGFRKPLGKLVSRELVKVQESSSLPGAPDGKYMVMSFKTVFEQKKSAVETATFALDKDQKWRAAGYFIR